jgi:hypothetical protein
MAIKMIYKKTKKAPKKGNVMPKKKVMGRSRKK